ncbi:hypothetical protein A6A08_18070 [Nocardiopsis sp. TSRI0078]|nr:hypothetical protein A6A08_18070 [Nocardiopsis sp. TSRI0078]
MMTTAVDMAGKCTAQHAHTDTSNSSIHRLGESARAGGAVPVVGLVGQSDQVFSPVPAARVVTQVVAAADLVVGAVVPAVQPPPPLAQEARALPGADGDAPLGELGTAPAGQDGGDRVLDAVIAAHTVQVLGRGEQVRTLAFVEVDVVQEARWCNGHRVLLQSRFCAQNRRGGGPSPVQVWANRWWTRTILTFSRRC